MEDHPGGGEVLFSSSALRTHAFQRRLAGATVMLWLAARVATRSSVNKSSVNNLDMTRERSSHYW